MMFEYFPGNYWWSAMVMNSLGMGGEISEIDRFCDPLKEGTGTRELMCADDDSKGAAWASAWRNLSDHLERLAAAEAEKGLWTAERTHEHATGASRRELRVFTLEESGAEHCQGDVMSMATDFIHDWLALFFDLEDQVKAPVV